MICEIIRGIACLGRKLEKAGENSDRKGFACDETPCFKDRDDEEEEDE